MLREIIDENRTPELPGLPTFTGGLVGYFSYDYIKYSEPKLRLSDEEKTDFRDMDLMLFDNVIAFDHYRQKIYIITGVRASDLEQSYEKAEAKLNEIEKLLKTGEKMEFPLAGTRPRGKDDQEDKRLYDLGRAKYVPITDDEAVDAFEYLSRIEGIIPAIEGAHAVAYAKKIVPQMDKDEIVVITLSGRGDKDCAAIARYRGEDIHE